MRNILLTLFLFSSLLFAKDANNNPEKVIEDFFYHFNEMDINKINELWDLPITYFVGDEIVVAKSYSEIVFKLKNPNIFIVVFTIYALSISFLN